MTVAGHQWRTTDALRRLRANVVAAASDAKASSILVTSIDSDDGGNGVVMNLAPALAMAGFLVVVVLARRVDAGLESSLQLNDRPGFTDALAGTARIHDTLCSTDLENLFFCGRGTQGAPAEAADPATDEAPIAIGSAATYSDLLGSDRPKQVIGELSATADYVLVDAPPVQIDADAYLLAGACDGVLAVATLATATRRDAEQTSDQLSRAGARLLGTVLIDPEQVEQRAEQQERISARWTNGLRTSESMNGEARVQPASKGALTEAVEA